MSNPELEGIDPRMPDNRLHPDIPIEEPPYDAGIEDTPLLPGIVVEELPYAEEADIEVGVRPEQPKHHLASRDKIPRTLQGHIALLDSAIEEAIIRKRPQRPLIRIGDETMTVPRYLATIAGGSKSGLTWEERHGLANLYIGSWGDADDGSEHGANEEQQLNPDQTQTVIAEVAVGSAMGVQPEQTSDVSDAPTNPPVVTDESGEDIYEERKRIQKDASWQERAGLI